MFGLCGGEGYGIMSAPMEKKTIFTYELDEAQQQRLLALFAVCGFKSRSVPYSLASVEGDGFNCTLYEKERHGKRKCCIQGGKAEDFVLFYMEPQVLLQASLGYEDVLDPERDAPHFGSDESGKGDWFGPLIVACVYTDGPLAQEMRELGAKDCKQMSDRQVLTVGSKLRALLGPERFAVVKFGNPAYNRVYSRIRNINRMLAWAHARAIEDLLEKQPQCPKGVLDQFARSESVMLRALMEKGRKIQLKQMHKAESDIAVAAASVIAREQYLRSIEKMNEEVFGPVPIGGRTKEARFPIGSSDPRVRELGEKMVRQFGAKWLMNHCKCHFQTTDKVLSACGLDRSALPPEGQIVSAVKNGDYDDGNG